MKYKCSKCKLAVIVLKDTPPIKACTCDAPIIAEMQGSMEMKGGIKVD